MTDDAIETMSENKYLDKFVSKEEKGTSNDDCHVLVFRNKRSNLLQCHFNRFNPLLVFIVFQRFKIRSTEVACFNRTNNLVFKLKLTNNNKNKNTSQPRNTHTSIDDQSRLSRRQTQLSRHKPTSLHKIHIFLCLKMVQMNTSSQRFVRIRLAKRDLGTFRYWRHISIYI